uniref:non-specific serine/threonine protein kinase n=1 Tax=Arundo donax TaxID=35708 RepID=A0A0A9FM95_ARUDO
MSSLVQLDFSGNQLEGRLGSEFARWPQDAFAGNAGLCGSPLRGCRGGGYAQSALHSASIALVSAAVTLAVVLLIIVLALTAARRRGRRSGEVNCTAFSSSLGSSNRQLVVKGSARREFRWEAIMEATANLSDQFAVGSGGSGTVYRAELPTGETVAVKRIAHMDSDVLLHDKSFTREVKILGRVRHRHLVKLLGFVTSHDGGMLVYEFMENGSLYDWLHGGAAGGDRKKRVLSWDARLQVAAGLAQGVEYLHHDCVPRIVHRDIKSSNVLLDGDMEAHLGDFGLAKAVAENRQAGGGGKDCTESASCFAGSYGYIAPECAYSLKATERSDVYSMGIVLMELVTGLTPTDKTFGGDMDMVRWVQSRIDAPLPAREQVFDPALKPLAPREETPMSELLEVALRCTRTAPGERPTARQVSDLLLHISLDYYQTGEHKR